MDETKATENWFVRHAEKEAKKNAIPFSERVGSAVAIVIIVLVALYFVAHQTRSTGFFTSKFGSVEMFLLYGTLLYQIVPTSLIALYGHKNLARLFEVFGSFWGIAAIVWLFMVFPFDFAHFADVLPSSLRFLLQWISNDLVKVLMALGIIASPIVAIYTAALYVFVRKELSKQTLRPS